MPQLLNDEQYNITQVNRNWLVVVTTINIHSESTSEPDKRTKSVIVRNDDKVNYGWSLPTYQDHDLHLEFTGVGYANWDWMRKETYDLQLQAKTAHVAALKIALYK